VTLSTAESSSPGRPETATQYAYRRIKAAILAGALQPGSRLNFRALQAELVLSHIPLREAVRLLCAEGLLVSEAHRAVTVADLTREQRDELYLVRAILEIPAALAAARRITPDVLDHMAQLNHTLSALDASGEHIRFLDLSDEFHRRLYAASGLPHLEKLIISHQELTRVYRTVNLVDHTARVRAIEQHGELLEALHSGDLVAVHEITLRHLLGRVRQPRAEFPSRALTDTARSQPAPVENWLAVLSGLYAPTTGGVTGSPIPDRRSAPTP
jgi:DNA-binding GntR family transcriptional regulator